MGQVILVVVFGLVLGIPLAAQEITTNAEGEAILQMPDGSWRYLEAGDTVYQDPEPQWDEKKYLHYLAAAQIFEEEVREVVDNSQERLYTLENMYTTAKSDNDVFALQEAELAINEQEEKLDKQESQLKYVRGLIKDIEKIGAKEKYPKLEKISIPLRYLNMTRDNYMVGKSLASVEVETKESKPMVRGRKEQEKVKKEKKAKPVVFSRNRKLKMREPKPKNTEEQSLNEKTSKAWVFSIPGQSKVHTANGCSFTFDGIDEFSGNARRDLAKEIFFTHTDQRLRPYLKNREYIVAEGYLSSVSGGYRYLTLTVRIASKNARREYGAVKPASLIKMTLLDGSTISLFSQNGSSGRLDPVTGDVVYQVSYGIDYQKAKLLQKMEVDQVRMVWSSGYEDYVVYNVDFFIRQLACLDAKVN